MFYMMTIFAILCILAIVALLALLLAGFVGGSARAFVGLPGGRLAERRARGLGRARRRVEPEPLPTSG